MAEHELNRAPSGAFARIKQPENLAVLGLLLLILSTSVSGITIALIDQDWFTLWRTLFFGLLLGWLLAIFRKPIWVAALTVLIAGILYILLFPGGIIGKAVNTAIEFGHLLPVFWNSFRGGDVDLSPLASLLQDLFASTWNIVTRVHAWLITLVAGQPNFDPVPAPLIWNALVWLIAAWAGWVVEARRDSLLAALPAIFLSLETLAYGHRKPFVIYVMLGSLLLLLAVLQQSRRRDVWDEASVAYPARKGWQITNAALLITIGLVLFSAFASSLSTQRIQEWIDGHQGSDSGLAKSLGVAPGETAAPDAFTVLRNVGLPQSHLVGSGPELSKRVIMKITVENLNSLPRSMQTSPFYWRAFTYDRYTGYGWRSSTTQQSPYKADQLLQSTRKPGYILIQQQVQPAEDLGVAVYAAGEPLMVNLKSEAAWRSNEDLFGVRLDQSAAYQADSEIPFVDEPTLRAAGQKYPDWVRERYLLLPTEVPDRVRALAIELTAPERTPYDRVRVIESYLRTFPYTLDVSAPPLGRDVADYFLFDLKKGYCDYYATSMVVLARAGGIPARLVIGYANGTYDSNSKQFVVTEADAHSWVEVYFPNIGWVTFEPTSSRPRLNQEDKIPAALQFTPPLTSPQNEVGLRVLRVLLGGLALASLLGISWIVFREVRLNYLEEQVVATEIYRRMRRYSTFLGVSSGLGDTPYEFTALLNDRLSRLSLKTDFIPQLIHDLQSLMDKIVQVLYCPSRLKTARNADVLQKWRSLRRKLWLVWMLERWKALASRFGLKRSL